MQTDPQSVKSFADDLITAADAARSRESVEPAAKPDGSLGRALTRAERRIAARDARKAVRARQAGLCGCIVHCSWFKSAGGCKRVIPRRPDVILFEHERELLRGMLSRAEKCGTRFVSLRKVVERGGRLVESRMVVQAPCGLRVCVKCDERMRKRHAARTLGMFTQFFTLGVPYAYGSTRQAWERILDDVKRLMHELRRTYREEPGINLSISKPGLKAVAKQNAERESGRREIPNLQYAWCVEPHESGYPHLHFVTNTKFIRKEWLEATWGHITGCHITWSHWRDVWSVKGVCWYLTKYISKCVLTADLNTILFGRRLHCSTLPKEWKPPDGWAVESGQDQAFLASMTDEKSDLPGRLGYTVAAQSDRKYVLMERDIGGMPDWLNYHDSLVASISINFEGSELALWDMVEIIEAKRSGVWKERCYHKLRAKISLTPFDKQKKMA